MLIHDQENIQEHMYAANSPLDLILMNKGIAYWLSSKNNVRKRSILVFSFSNYRSLFTVSNTSTWQLDSSLLFAVCRFRIFRAFMFLFAKTKTKVLRFKRIRME